ncbi:hypothetical protein M758_10G117200 [Ceratodon purpureus]|nr:hypothetical protein M758_10G117200 [Ceratodon purpureus]
MPSVGSGINNRGVDFCSKNLSSLANEVLTIKLEKECKDRHRRGHERGLKFCYQEGDPFYSSNPSRRSRCPPQAPRCSQQNTLQYAPTFCSVVGFLIRSE